MNFLRTHFVRFFFSFGERSAIVIVVIIYLLFLSFQGSKHVYSQEEEQFFRQTPIYDSTGDSSTNIVSDNFTAMSISLDTEKITPTPTPVPVLPTDDVWDRLAKCESKGNWGIDTGNGYFGGLQFSQGAWNSVGGIGKPSDASREEQIKRGQMLQSMRGWAVWGICAKKLGLN